VRAVTTSSVLPKQYDPSEVEPRWLRFWLENGFFHADDSTPKIPYTITLPPPNVTGSLHMGHALGSTLQDILIRWKRMLGFNAMWMPGIDHASIAVHVLLEKDLKRREQKTRFDLGREEFLRRAWAWKERSGNRIGEQEKKLGFSLDWERERFTMDEASNRAVIEAFVRLYEEGLIFRAKRMINWDPASETVVSDLEVDTVEESGHLWDINYPIVDGGGQAITVSTTRPETMLGDTAVAVHPSDERYKHLHGKLVELPLTGRQIPIVAIELVRDGKVWPDPEFGSGAVKVTPAHDPNDYAVYQAMPDIGVIEVIDRKARMMAPSPEKYVGMTVEAARKAVVADLEAAGCLGAVKDYKVPRARSQRSGAVIEPLLMDQWWVKAAPLAEKALAAVKDGKTKFVPAHHTKVFENWMTNIQDWCISRQLWWGHRIPAWHCSCGHITVAREAPAACTGCGGASLAQDPDILDTWFSSGLWPFSTLGWPDKTRALASFYPNQVLVTGPDIIFFWVARMMMMGLHFMGKVPFKTVYLTAIVTDENGQKMSKTKGNVLDPLDVVYGATLQQLLERADAENAPESALKAIRKTYDKRPGRDRDGIPAMGADALRFALAIRNTTGYIRISVDRVETERNFINKLWNASRFALMNLDGFDAERFEAQLATPAGRAALAMPERWILSRLQAVTGEVQRALEEFEFAAAANAIRHFIWDELCDWYIELAKSHLHLPGDPTPAKATRRHVVQGVLATVLESTMRLLHPFAPYVTEEIWQQLPKPPQLPGSLMITVFPKPDPAYVDAAAEAEMQLVQDVAVGCRMLRATYGVTPQKTVTVGLRAAPGSERRALLEQHRELIERSARAQIVIGAAFATEGEGLGARDAGADAIATPPAKTLVGADVEVVMPLGGLIDFAQELKRIQRDLGKAEKEIATLETKLAKPEFIAKADPEVVAENRTRLVDEQQRRQRLLDAIATLGGPS
jgi:valyl-tRNA synthetase